VFIERLVTLHNAMKEDKSFMDRIKDYIHDGKIDSAINLCRSIDTPASRMIEKGISRIGRPMQDVQVAVENVGNLEVGKLEKGMVIIATIAAGAPMLGFLGTVLGMVQTFFNMAQNASGVIEITALSEGMYQAMVTTIGGLIVGILAMFAYNFLVARVDRVVRQLEGRTLEFMDLLNEPA
jgi:biopolymer transport protein ExbB